MRQPSRIEKQPSRIEKEQAELLLALVEAYRLRREPFAVIEVMNAMGHVLVRHPGFTEEMSIPPNDLRMLEREGFLLVTERGRGIRFLIPTPEAQEFYRSVKTEGSTPIARVETEVRQFLSSSAMDFYPRAFAAWRRTESLYRQLDAADPRLSEIGHQCREAIQAFAAELAKRHRVTEIDPDPTKTINLVTAVLRARTGDTVAEFLDALIDYWRKLTSLVQRQEHSGQKEGRPVGDVRGPPSSITRVKHADLPSCRRRSCGPCGPTRRTRPAGGGPCCPSTKTLTRGPARRGARRPSTRENSSRQYDGRDAGDYARHKPRLPA